jgi:hypothetical protein
VGGLGATMIFGSLCTSRCVLRRHLRRFFQNGRSWLGVAVGVVVVVTVMALLYRWLEPKTLRCALDAMRLRPLLIGKASYAASIAP